MVDECGKVLENDDKLYKLVMLNILVFSFNDWFHRAFGFSRLFDVREIAIYYIFQSQSINCAQT